MLIPSKLLTSLPVLLEQIKAGNSSYELKNEIRERNLLYQHNITTKRLYKGTAHWRQEPCNNNRTKSNPFWFM